jgi:hypothetical protein
VDVILPEGWHQMCPRLCLPYPQSFTMTLGGDAGGLGVSSHRSNNTGTGPQHWSSAAGVLAEGSPSATATSSHSRKGANPSQLHSEAVGSVSFTSAAEPEQQGRWRFCLLQPKPGFTAALCVEQAAVGLQQSDDWWQEPLLSMWQTVPLHQDQAILSNECLLATS